MQAFEPPLEDSRAFMFAIIDVKLIVSTTKSDYTHRLPYCERFVNPTFRQQLISGMYYDRNKYISSLGG